MNRDLFKRQKGEKYGNKKVTYDGITFDSIRERDRYIILKDAEKRGVISELETHPRYELVPAVWHDEVVHLKTKDKIVSKCKQRAITYSADFRYKKSDGTVVVEDVKISPHMLPKDFLLKEKMLFAFKGVQIKRVYKPNDLI